MKLTEAVGCRVEQLLAERRMTQAQLAKKGQIAKSTVCNLVKADNDTVTLDTVYRVCRTLNISFEQFFSDDVFVQIEA